MPLSQASLEERLRKMAKSTAAVKATAEAFRESVSQPEATATPRTLSTVAPPPSILSERKR